MTTQNRIFDDLSKLMTNAMGVAQGAKSEAETAFNSWIDRWLADRDFVTREDFEAVREMAIKARTEAAELRARLDRLDPQSARTEANAAASPSTAPVPGAAEITPSDAPRRDGMPDATERL